MVLRSSIGVASHFHSHLYHNKVSAACAIATILHVKKEFKQSYVDRSGSYLVLHSLMLSRSLGKVLAFEWRKHAGFVAEMFAEEPLEQLQFYRSSIISISVRLWTLLPIQQSYRSICMYLCILGADSCTLSPFSLLASLSLVISLHVGI